MHTALWRAITCGKAVPVNIEKELSKKLKLRGKPTSTSPMLVVVLDEIDQLMSKNRQVLRKLFEWADAPKSRLVSDVMFRSCARGREHLFFGRHPAVPVFPAVSVLPSSMYIWYVAQPTRLRVTLGRDASLGAYRSCKVLCAEEY